MPSKTNDKELIGSGLPVTEGIVVGRARIVKKTHQMSHDVDTFQYGEILVAKTTLPEWEPLFSVACGVITEYGGYGSHAAQVAPGYGIPCIVGIEGLTRKVKDGDWLQIDANIGEVYRVERSVDTD
jgi:pyruvate,water dikinase